MSACFRSPRSFVVLLTIALCLGVRGLPEEPFVRGDANVDESVDLADAVFVLRALFDRGRLLCTDAADVDDSGLVDLSDPIYLLNFLFKNGPSPRFPFPACGRDPTEDDLGCLAFGPCPVFVNSIGMRFVYIPPGTFLMGSPEDEVDRWIDETLHEVTLTCGFYMSETEVTQAQYREVMGRTPAINLDNVWEEWKNTPVIYVTWTEAVDFCRRLSGSEGRVHRLPTEAEWEYACRARTRTRFFFGDALECPVFEHSRRSLPCQMDGPCPLAERFMWWNENWPTNWPKPPPVAQRAPNPWGLYDISGNVAEWCSDWYGPYPREPVVDPAGPPSGQRKVVRGNAHYSFCHGRSASRSTPWTIDTRASHGGFRVVAGICDRPPDLTP